MVAAAMGHVNVLKTLIENKADVNMLTKVHVLHNCVHTVLYTITIQRYTFHTFTTCTSTNIQRDLVLYVVVKNL